MGLSRLGLTDIAIAAWIRSVDAVASRTPRPWRRWVPTVTMRLCARAAWIIHLPSSMNSVIGFST